MTGVSFGRLITKDRYGVNNSPTIAFWCQLENPFREGHPPGSDSKAREFHVVPSGPGFHGLYSKETHVGPSRYAPGPNSNHLDVVPELGKQ